MKKKFWIYICLAVSILAALLLLWPRIAGSGPDFYRVEIQGIDPDPSRFRVNKQIGKLYFKRKDREIFLEHIPSIRGQYFYLNGEKQILIKPEISGDIGFYTHLYFQTVIKREPIAFMLEKLSRGKRQKITEIQYGRMSRPLFQTLKLRSGDRLNLKFKGTGVVYFSQPIIYRKKPVQEQSHVFLIGVDTLRGDQIGLKVGGKSLTPNIDRFLKDGVCFKNAYAQSPWTIPSFISLFTGLYEFNHQVDISHPLDLDKTLLTENLSKKFITFAFHGGCALDARWGYHRGFDSYQLLATTGPLFPEGGKALFNRTISFLKQSQFPRAFYFLHTYQVHSPYTPPRDFLYRLNPRPKNLELTAISHGNLAEKYVPVEPEMRHSLEELYRAEVLAFDSYFGQFIRDLKKMNLYDRSFIILMSDHGEEFFEHKGWEHCHSLYDELIRVPLVLKFPRNRFHNREIDEPVGVIDIMPTLLDYYRIPSDGIDIDGISLLPWVTENSGTKREYVMSSVSVSRYILALPPKLAFRFGDYKLIYNFPLSDEDQKFFKYPPPPSSRIELFNLSQDPLEIRNIAGLEEKKVKRFLPLILDIKKRIQKTIRERSKRPLKLDKEVQKKLETLGYL